jgi:CPA2 family monovalent cation:H+ antiporter-2
MPELFPLAALVGASLMKGIVTGGVVALLWRSRELGIVTGLGLAQIGEFSFVLAHQGVQVGLMSRELEQAFLGAAILTMAATPLFVGAGKRLRRVGEQRDGVSIHFGDASRRAVLDAMSASRARAAVVTVGEPAATRRIVALLRQGSETLRVIVRARRVNEISELERIGADDVIPSEFETSIEILVRLLQHLGVPRHVVRIQESLIRAEHYRALRGLGTTAELLGDIRKIVAGGLIEVVHLAQGSPAAGRTLAELELQRRLGVVVLSVVREEQPLPAPGGDTRLEAGDVIVIYGAHESLDDALELFEAPHGEGDAPR